MDKIEEMKRRDSIFEQACGNQAEEVHNNKKGAFIKCIQMTTGVAFDSRQKWQSDGKGMNR
jgi:hypothetical protein